MQRIMILSMFLLPMLLLAGNIQTTKSEPKKVERILSRLTDCEVVKVETRVDIDNSCRVRKVELEMRNRKAFSELQKLLEVKKVARFGKHEYVDCLPEQTFNLERTRIGIGISAPCSFVWLYHPSLPGRWHARLTDGSKQAYTKWKAKYIDHREKVQAARAGHEQKQEKKQAAKNFPNTLEHTVSPDETLKMIADMYATEVDVIIKANEDIESKDDLEGGMTVTVPYD